MLQQPDPDRVRESAKNRAEVGFRLSWRVMLQQSDPDRVGESAKKRAEVGFRGG